MGFAKDLGGRAAQAAAAEDAARAGGAGSVSQWALGDYPPTGPAKGWQLGDTDGLMPWWSDVKTELEVTRTDLMCFFFDLTNESFCLTKIESFGMKNGAWLMSSGVKIPQFFGGDLGDRSISTNGNSHGIPYDPTRIYQDIPGL